MSRTRISRRKFVGDVGAGVAFTIVPRHVLGRGYRAPSDKVNVACIGVGGMGRNDVRGMEGENIYALCDVDWKSAEDAFQTYIKAKRYKDYREMFDKESKNIDAVTVSTPDHSPAAAGMLAMKAGKHAYLQRPPARTMAEGRALAAYARSHPKVRTQMGNQGHARDGTRQVREWVEAGAIGTVREVHFWTNRPIWPQAIDRPLEEYYAPATLDWNLWLGPAPERPYHPAYAPFKWRGFWDFGHRRAGRHGLPHHGRRLLDARSRLPHAHRGRVHAALQGDGAGRFAHQLQLRGERKAPRSEGGVARRQPLPTATGRGRGRRGLAVRQRRGASMDRERRQAHRGHLRRRPQAAHGREAGRRER